MTIARGLNYVFVPVGLEYASPIWLATLRGTVGTAGIAPYLLWFERGHRLDRRGRRDALLLGIPNTTLFIGLWFYAATSVPPGQTAVLIYTFPLWVALLSAPVLHHRLTAGHWSSVGLGFVGVFLISQPWVGVGIQSLWVPYLELLGAAVSWAVGTVLFQRRFRPDEMPVANGYQLLGGSAVLLVAALAVQPTPSGLDSLPLWIAVAWLGLAGTSFAFAAWFRLLGHVGSGALSAYSFLIPLVALGASIVAYGERLGLYPAIGVGAVLVSIYGIGRAGGGAGFHSSTSPSGDPDGTRLRAGGAGTDFLKERDP